MVKYVAGFFVSFLFFFVAGCSLTTEPTSPQDEIAISTADVTVIAVADHLDLTPEQKEKIAALMKEHREAVQALLEAHKKGNISREELQTKLKALDEKFEEALKGILTPEQFEAWKKENDRIKQMGGIPYPLVLPLDYLAKALSLSPEQVEKAKMIINQAMHDMRQAIVRINDRHQLHRVFEEVLQRANRQFMSILSREQAQMYEQIKQKMRPPMPPYPLPIHLEQLAHALQLTPEQIQQAKGIVEKGQQDIRSAMENIKEKDKLQAALQEILKWADGEFTKLLTKEQAEKYQLIKKSMHQPKFPYPLPLPLEQLAQLLTLSQEQIMKAKMIVDMAARDIRAVVDHVRNPQELEKAIESILKKADAQFNSILNEAQKAKYQEIKQQLQKQRSGNG